MNPFAYEAIKTPIEQPKKPWEDVKPSSYRTQSEGLYSLNIQRINVSADLGREQILELGRREPYYRYDIEFFMKHHRMPKDGEI